MERVSLPIFTHADMRAHNPGQGHAERPERLGAVLDALQDAGLAKDMRDACLVSRQALRCVHTASYIDRIFHASPFEGVSVLDADTIMSIGSLNAALRAAGAVVDAVNTVASGASDRAFCAVRPPGHHAEPSTAMGFCIFSNVAIGAYAALANGFERVAVIDFDVHHGNGTQAVFETNPQLFLGSIHQSPLYPGTGGAHEKGVGNIVNAPSPPRAPPSVWRRLFDDRLMPKLDAFAPDMILISAGFDAHRRDPLAQQELEAEDFAWATRAIMAVARKHSRGRVVSSLEGGYDLEALGQSAVAHVAALAEG